MRNLVPTFVSIGLLDCAFSTSLTVSMINRHLISVGTNIIFTSVTSWEKKP